MFTNLDEGVGLIAVQVQGSNVEHFVKTYAEAAAEADDTNFSSSDTHRSGQFFHFCAYYDDEPVLNSCEVQWADDELLVSVWFVGEWVDGIDLGDAQHALAGLLDELVDSLVVP